MTDQSEAGDLDDVVLWNSELSRQEVQTLAARNATALGAVDQKTPGSLQHPEEVYRNFGGLRLNLPNGRLVDVWVTHLEVATARARVREAKEIFDRVQNVPRPDGTFVPQTEPGIPIILGGDFNADPTMSLSPRLE